MHGGWIQGGVEWTEAIQVRAWPMICVQVKVIGNMPNTT